MMLEDFVLHIGVKKKRKEKQRKEKKQMQQEKPLMGLSSEILICCRA